MTAKVIGSGALLGGMVRMEDRAPDTSDANLNQCWSGVQTVEFILMCVLGSTKAKLSTVVSPIRILEKPMTVGGEGPLPQCFIRRCFPLEHLECKLPD